MYLVYFVFSANNPTNNCLCFFWSFKHFSSYFFLKYLAKNQQNTSIITLFIILSPFVLGKTDAWIFTDFILTLGSSSLQQKLFL